MLRLEVGDGPPVDILAEAVRAGVRSWAEMGLVNGFKVNARVEGWNGRMRNRIAG